MNRPIFSRALLAACAVLCLALAGCAMDIVSVKQLPATLTPLGAPSPAFTLQNDASIAIGTGFKTRLKKGTTWRKVGTLGQGDVFTTRDQVVTVEASHIHEAQVVISGGSVVGFYLPVERTFTPASTPVPVAFESQP